MDKEKKPTGGVSQSASVDSDMAELIACLNSWPAPGPPTDSGSAEARQQPPLPPSRQRWGRRSAAITSCDSGPQLPTAGEPVHSQPLTSGACQRGTSSDRLAVPTLPVPLQEQIRSYVPPPPRRCVPVPVLLSQAQLLQLSTAQCQGLHKEARACLQTAITDMELDSALMRIDLVSSYRWPRWREYVANHGCQARFVASGITAVTAERVAKKDPNRGGAIRVDIIFHHAEGGCCRIHPGSKASNDAKPKYILRYVALDPEWGA